MIAGVGDLPAVATSDVTSLVGGLLIGFAAGSIPFGYLLVRLKTGNDVRDTGSGNIGATNVARALGTGGGVLTLLLDAAKGAVGVVAAAYVGGVVLGLEQTPWMWSAALGAVLGHCYTPWLRLRGGKGVATWVGAFGIAAPGPMAAALAVFLVTGTFGRMVSLASLCASLTLPVALAWWQQASYPPHAVASGALAAAVIFWRHRANIGRILEGRESKLGRAKS